MAAQLQELADHRTDRDGHISFAGHACRDRAQPVPRPGTAGDYGYPYLTDDRALIISATGMFFFYSDIGRFMEGTLGMNKNFVGYVKVILAHAVLGIPFVIITVTATLVGFDRSLTRAAANMGAGPVRTFFSIQMPLILPGVISGGLFAFITSFDEVVVVLFVGSASQKTLPWQMFTGLREQISPTILAVATILVVLSIALLTTVELLRRRSERLRGLSPA